MPEPTTGNDSELLARISRLESAIAAMRPDRSAYAGRNGIQITGSSANMIIDASQLLRRIEALERRAGERRTTIVTQAPSTPGATTRTLDRLNIRMSAQVDDDIRIRIGGITVYDPKQIVAPLRDVSLGASEIRAKGASTQTGVLVQIDTYDGQHWQYSLRPWNATAYYTDGTSRAFSGGSTLDGTSNIVPTYYANGSFTL
jgi:hypothetical protein